MPVIFIAGQWISQRGAVPIGPPLYNEALALLSRAFYRFPDRFRLEQVRGRPPYSHQLLLPTGDRVLVLSAPLSAVEAEQCFASPHYGRFSVPERDRAAGHLWPSPRPLSLAEREEALAAADLGPGETVSAAMALGLTGWRPLP